MGNKHEELEVSMPLQGYEAHWDHGVVVGLGCIRSLSKAMGQDEQTNQHGGNSSGYLLQTFLIRKNKKRWSSDNWEKPYLCFFLWGTLTCSS